MTCACGHYLQIVEDCIHYTFMWTLPVDHGGLYTLHMHVDITCRQWRTVYITCGHYLQWRIVYMCMQTLAVECGGLYTCGHYLQLVEDYIHVHTTYRLWRTVYTCMWTLPVDHGGPYTLHVHVDTSCRLWRTVYITCGHYLQIMEDCIHYTCMWTLSVDHGGLYTLHMHVDTTCSGGLYTCVWEHYLQIVEDCIQVYVDPGGLYACVCVDFTCRLWRIVYMCVCEHYLYVDCEGLYTCVWTLPVDCE